MTDAMHEPDSYAPPTVDGPALELAAGTPVRELATEDDSDTRRVPGKRTRVLLEGHEPFEVRVDNRDYLRWDKTAPRQKWGAGQDVPFLFGTFLAWSAAVRAGLTTLKWEQFSAIALEVENVKEEDEDLAGPTR